MRTLLFVVAAARLRGPVALPFPDVKDAEAALNEQPEAVVAPEPEATAQAPKQEATDVSAWHMPTLAPDNVVQSADQFKHPTDAMLKDWETAPKIDMFEAPTEKPVEVAKVEADEKPKEAALPEVKSKLHPVNPYGKRDNDPELAAIQNESPEAYGIVKALLMKKNLGLPMPGAEAAQNARESREEMGGSKQNPDASTSHINNMWAWKPKDTASDEVSVAQEMGEVSEAPAPTEAPAPVEEEVRETSAPAEELAAPAAPAEEAKAEDPAPAMETETPAAPQETDAQPAAQASMLSSWLGAAPSKAAAPVEQEVKVPKQAMGLMSKYALDLA